MYISNVIMKRLMQIRNIKQLQIRNPTKNIALKKKKQIMFLATAIGFLSVVMNQVHRIWHFRTVFIC